MLTRWLRVALLTWGVTAAEAALADATDVSHRLILRFPDQKAIVMQMTNVNAATVASCVVHVQATVLVSGSGQPTPEGAFTVGSISIRTEVNGLEAELPQRVTIGEKELAEVAADSGALGYFFLSAPQITSMQCVAGPPDAQGDNRRSKAGRGRHRSSAR
jgi:hypothetical protein